MHVLSCVSFHFVFHLFQWDVNDKKVIFNLSFFLQVSNLAPFCIYIYVKKKFRYDVTPTEDRTQVYTLLEHLSPGLLATV